MIQILLVDDEEYSLKSMKNLIPWNQWQCEIAAVADSAHRALEIIGEIPIDIVFTDIRMPGMDGLELIREIRKKEKEISFVIISGYSEFEYACTAMQYGVKNYLLKPVGISEVEETLLSLSDEHQIREAQIRHRHEPVRIDVDYFVERILSAVTGNNWNGISGILLDFFKEISRQKGSLEQCRVSAISLLSTLVRKEIIFFNDSTLLLAGEIGSAETQKGIYSILKDQILITQNQSRRACNDRMNPHVQKILVYLLSHYRENRLSLKWLSENVTFVKSDYLGKLFLKETGKSFTAYLNEFRVNRAREILRTNPKMPIGELAERVGYSDNASYFIKQYKQITGMTPARFAAGAVG